MGPNDKSTWSSADARQQMGNAAFSSLIAGGLMLYVGYFISWHSDSDSRLYDVSVNGFTWMMRWGGCFTLLCAVLCFSGQRVGLLMDAVSSVLIGTVMLAVAGVWLLNSDFEGILLLIFGALFLRSGLATWVAYRESAPVLGDLAAVTDPATESSAEPVVDSDQAAVRTDALKRVLDRKKVETASPPEPVARREPEFKKPVVAEPVREAAKRVEPKADEPAPQGFLAELGRSDGQERK